MSLLLAVTIVGKFIYDLEKSSRMDEESESRYKKAFELNAESKILVKTKSEYCEKRLMNVAKKKAAIIENTVPDFVKIYDQIQKIELDLSSNNSLVQFNKNISKISQLNEMALTHRKELTAKENVALLLTGGIKAAILGGGLVGGALLGLSGSIKKDSERELSAANKQYSAAKVTYEQAKNIAAVYDSIAERADRIANVLSKLNVLFVKSIKETAKTIEKNGLNVRNYSKYDIGVLMTCVNIASAVSDIIDIPVIDKDGEIAKEAEQMILSGEEFITEINKAVAL